jgi:hypothetical protein
MLDNYYKKIISLVIILLTIISSIIYLYEINHHRGEHKVADISGIKYHCFVNDKGKEYYIIVYNNTYHKKTFVINLADNHNLVIHEKDDNKLISLLLYVILGSGIGISLYLIDKKMKSVH